MSADDNHYEELLAELRVAGLVVDPVPERVTFAANASLAWRTIDAELAELTYDSALDADRLTLVRGAAAARMLTFSTAGLTVDIEVEEHDGRLRLIAGRAPAEPAVVAIRHPEGSIEVETDETGRFRSELVPA